MTNARAALQLEARQSSENRDEPVLEVIDAPFVFLQRTDEVSGNTPVIGGFAAAASARAVAPAATPAAITATEPVATAAAPDLVAEIRKLADLCAEGILDDEEFATAKRKLLEL